LEEQDFGTVALHLDMLRIEQETEAARRGTPVAARKKGSLGRRRKRK
jgi:hypothetical protein